MGLSVSARAFIMNGIAAADKRFPRKGRCRAMTVWRDGRTSIPATEAGGCRGQETSGAQDRPPRRSATSGLTRAGDYVHKRPARGRGIGADAGRSGNAWQRCAALPAAKVRGACRHLAPPVRSPRACMPAPAPESGRAGGVRSRRRQAPGQWRAWRGRSRRQNSEEVGRWRLWKWQTRAPCARSA
jgi:hypothetical protein